MLNMTQRNSESKNSHLRRTQLRRKTIPQLRLATVKVQYSLSRSMISITFNNEAHTSDSIYITTFIMYVSSLSRQECSRVNTITFHFSYTFPKRWIIIIAHCHDLPGINKVNKFWWKAIMGTIEMRWITLYNLSKLVKDAVPLPIGKTTSGYLKL